MKKLLCYLLGHRYGETRVEPPQMIDVLSHRIEGTVHHRQIPGFIRRTFCTRCGFSKDEIVFTPKWSN